MNILSIDQSYTSCGFVVLRDDQIVFAERFVTDKTQDIFDRAAQVALRAAELADIYSVKYVALEGLAFAKVGNATRDLAGLQFTIVYVIKRIMNKEVVIISPNTVKKVATGKGDSKKELLFEALPECALNYFLSLGVKKTTGLLDLTDAYWIGRAAQETKIAEEKQ